MDRYEPLQVLRAPKRSGDRPLRALKKTAGESGGANGLNAF